MKNQMMLGTSSCAKDRILKLNIKDITWFKFGGRLDNLNLMECITINLLSYVFYYSRR